jgi:hypothetical protein
MELRADVSEQDLLRLRPGQRATLVAAEGSAPIAATVRLVEPTIDPQTRLGTARIAIDNPSLVVKGMFLTAEVIVSQEEMLAVPVTAVGSGPGGSTVTRVEGGVAERVTVTTGIRDGGLIGVLDGLEAGDLVVSKAGAFVRPGDRINPVPAAEEAEPAPTQVAAPAPQAEAATPAAAEPAPAEEAAAPTEAPPAQAAPAPAEPVPAEAEPVQPEAADEPASTVEEAAGPGESAAGPVPAAVGDAPEAPPVRPDTLAAPAPGTDIAPAQPVEGE